jgi:hypothetical protein
VLTKQERLVRSSRISRFCFLCGGLYGRIAACEKPVPTFSRDAAGFMAVSLPAKNRFPLFRVML